MNKLKRLPRLGVHFVLKYLILLSFVLYVSHRGSVFCASGAEFGCVALSYLPIKMCAYSMGQEYTKVIFSRWEAIRIHIHIIRADPAAAVTEVAPSPVLALQGPKAQQVNEVAWVVREFLAAMDYQDLGVVEVRAARSGHRVHKDRQASATASAAGPPATTVDAAATTIATIAAAGAGAVAVGAGAAVLPVPRVRREVPEPAGSVPEALVQAGRLVQQGRQES